MADTTRGQSNNPDQHCYTNNNTTPESEEAAAAFRQFIRDPRTVFKTAPQMPDPVRGLSPNLDQLCYPSQAPITLESFFPPDEPLPLPEFQFLGPLSDICKFIPDLCDKLPSTIGMTWEGTQPCLVVDGKPCNDPTDTPGEPAECLKAAIDCIFKPYVEGGGWTPTAADPETFFPPGFNKNTENKICIINCVPTRKPIYELKYIGNNGRDYYYTDDENDVPPNYIQTSNVVGGGIKRISFSVGQSNGYYNESKWKQATIDKSIRNEAGGLWWPSEPQQKYEQVFTFGTGGAALDLLVAMTRQGGGDRDTRYVLREIENPGTGYMVGQTFPIYSPTTNVVLGYIRVDAITNQNPAFWVMENQQADTVPLQHYFSTVKRDSFLTTDPVAEAGRISSDQYVFQKTLGYVVQNNEKMANYLCEDEIGRQLLRYFFPGGGQKDKDHRYSITPLAISQPLKPSGKRNVFDMPNNATQPLRIKWKSERGSASKKSSWGYYLAKADGKPVEGRVLRRNMTDSNGSSFYDIPVEKVNEFASGKLGFFVFPDGGGSGRNPSLVDGSAITFDYVPLANARMGYRAKIGSTTLYMVSGVPGNSMGGENYIFMSDKDLNPDKNDWTSWSGPWQGWEDWAGGDNDFDDIKVNYEVKFSGEDYRPEGVQCYVFRNDALPKIYMTTAVRSGCEEDRLFKTSFNDPILHRLGCGSDITGEQRSGTCTGAYVTRINCDQTINVRMDGEIALYSWGLDGIGDTEETRWRMKLSINNNVVLDSEYSTMSYPKKGRLLFPTMTVKKGDTMKFELTDLLVASNNGQVWPKISFYDDQAEIHESIMTLTLRSGSTDEKANNFSLGSGTGIKQIMITDGEGNNGVVGWDNNATGASLNLDSGDNLWRSLKKNERDNITHQRATISFTKVGVAGIINAMVQIRVEPVLDTITKRYKSSIKIEQVLFSGKGYAVGDEIVVDFPTLLYYGTKRIPSNKRIKFKLKVTGVTT